MQQLALDGCFIQLPQSQRRIIDNFSTTLSCNRGRPLGRMLILNKGKAVWVVHVPILFWRSER